MKTIYKDPTNMDKRCNLTEIVRQRVKADLKTVRKLTPSIIIELKDDVRDMTNYTRMELEDYVIWAGCACLLIFEQKKWGGIYKEGDTVFIEGRKRRK